MSKPVIIFGAGASHALKDMIGTHLNNGNLYPPLTNGLFDERFTHIIKKYDLIKEQLHAIKRHVKNKNLEVFLNDLKKRDTEITQRQLIEMELYLRELFKEICKNFIQPEFKRSSHYVPFLRRFKKAHIITFNYDLFLDEAIKTVFGDSYDYEKYRTIENYYINKDIELIKVHGSINWGYVHGPLLGFNSPKNLRDEVDIIQNIKWMGALAQNTKEPSIIQEGEIKDDYYAAPALAIPISKDKRLIVENFQKIIIDRLKNTNKIIIIGWSAGDDYFTDLIKDNIDFETAELIVISPSSSEEVVKKLTPKKESEILTRSSKNWKKKPREIKESFSIVANDPEILDSIFE